MQSNGNATNKHPYRILLVDDDSDISLSFSIILESNGFVVDVFNDPLLVLSSFKQGLYAIALLDIKMPKMNGFELYREIRKIDNKVKICFITAFNVQNEKLKEVAPMLDAEKYIIKKPIATHDLVARVKAELNK